MLDVLHKLITCDEVAVVKMNPVNDYLGPLLRRALAPLVERGFVEFAYGGAGAVRALRALRAPRAVQGLSGVCRARAHNHHPQQRSRNARRPVVPRRTKTHTKPNQTETDVGRALCEHPAVASVHLTGSADTYNAIVWGGRDAPVSARGGGVLCAQSSSVA